MLATKCSMIKNVSFYYYYFFLFSSFQLRLIEPCSSGVALFFFYFSFLSENIFLSINGRWDFFRFDLFFP